MLQKNMIKPSSLDHIIDKMIHKAIELTKLDFDRKISSQAASTRRRANPSLFSMNNKSVVSKK